MSLKISDFPPSESLLIAKMTKPQYKTTKSVYCEVSQLLFLMFFGRVCIY